MRGTAEQPKRWLPLVMAGLLVIIAVAGIGYWRYASHRASPAPAAVTALPAPASSAAAAVTPACLVPGPPPVPPRGAVAGAAEMKLAHDVMQGYVNALQAYQKCQEQRIAQAPAGTTPVQKEEWRADGNQAIDQAHAAADAFSAQLRIYQARQ